MNNPLKNQLILLQGNITTNPTSGLHRRNNRDTRDRDSKDIYNNDTQIYTYTYNDSITLKQAYIGKIRPNIPEKELEEFIL